jgi:hypothetical protein
MDIKEDFHISAGDTPYEQVKSARLLGLEIALPGT